ncbi:PREDICTED: eukaryotic translation initiation factor 4E-1A isoform X2 [Nicrophorus vespilloides]|uniref:eIF-4F 25 kDa subunit n=1 Tax=Nicrophorus vespilloides TaxID=110193 RepID=A0ABM1MGW2_NICVS|nr:PREDICTED: eukaryotic translation initiation factor 4E-1A isoform X2 [Nicrophorus vespilloides]
MSTNNIENENEKNDNKDQEIVDNVDFTIKHPLQNKWTLWYYENDRTNTWEKNQKEIASFDTVEDFWSLYNHIKLASELRQGCDYSLFKAGIRPMWEDAANKRGGRWLINLERKQRSNDLDRFWLDIILCLIGEAFENSDDVCGAVVNIRGKGDKIGIWTADATNSEGVKEIGRKLKDRLHIKQKDTIGYQVHKDTMDKSVAKNFYTV